MMKVDARDAEQGQQRVHVVLIGFGMIGVADIHAHRQAQELAAEMVLERGAGDLFAVVQVFRADESDHRIHQQRRKARATA